jgi:hypothetical protein
MNTSALVLALLADAPEFFADAESLVTGLAHGEGGLGKIAALAQNLSALTGHVSTALVQVAGSVQQPNPPPPPPAAAG